MHRVMRWETSPAINIRVLLVSRATAIRQECSIGAAPTLPPRSGYCQREILALDDFVERMAGRLAREVGKSTPCLLDAYLRLVRLTQIRW